MKARPRSLPDFEDELFTLTPRDTGAHPAFGVFFGAERSVPVFGLAFKHFDHAGPTLSILTGREDLDAVFSSGCDDRLARRDLETEVVLGELHLKGAVCHSKRPQWPGSRD